MAKTTEITIYNSRRTQQHTPSPLPGITRLDTLRVLNRGYIRKIKAFATKSRAVARKPRDAAAVLFADDIHYKFKSSQASKATLQSSEHTGAKQNLTQNGNSKSFKVMCFGGSGKAIKR